MGRGYPIQPSRSPISVTCHVGLSAVARSAQTRDVDRHAPASGEDRQGEMGMKVTGGCHCGSISFEAEIDPAQVRICHCTDCQTLTGTAFRTTVSSLPGTFILRSGTPKIYIKTAEAGTSGRRRSAPSVAHRFIRRPRALTCRPM